MKWYAGLLIFLIFCDPFDLAAQRTQEGKFGITFNLPGAVDFLSFPAIQLGLEYKPGKHFAWFGEVGVEYLPWNIGGPDTMLLRSHGFKAKIELRYYVKPARYVAFNLFFARDAHNDQVYYIPGNDTTAMRTDDFGVRRMDLGWNVVLGREEWLFGRIWADLYFGFGMRYGVIHTVGQQINHSTDYIIHPIDPNIPYALENRDVKAGHGVVPNLTLGLRLMGLF